MYKREELQNYINPDRVSPIVLQANLGWIFTLKHVHTNTGHEQWPRGMHGYSTSYPSMHSIFLAKGPAFDADFKEKISPFSNVELYQVMCRIIGLKTSPNNGSMEWLNSQRWLKMI